jgi:hypothetical protein
VPRNPDTLLQRNVRRSFADAVKSWQFLTDEEKYKFTRKARRTHMSGYNLFISEFIKESISAGSRPEERLSFTDLLNSSGIHIYIHSVSASLRFLFNIILTVNQQNYNPG